MAPQIMQMDREKIKLNLARLKKGGETFEVIIDDINKAIDLKHGKDVPVRDIMRGEFIYKDAHKAEKSTDGAMNQWLGTSDHLEGAKIVIQKGDLNLTSEQRKKLIDQKRQKVIAYINRNAIDPKTKLPIPAQRVELAMEEAKARIDPAEPVDFLIKQTIEKLRPILPLSFELVRIRVVIPSRFSGSAYSAVKKNHNMKNETWRNDGSVQFELEVPGGLKSDLYSTLNKLTNGEIQIEEMK